jgi:hypothetical protein
MGLLPPGEDGPARAARSAAVLDAVRRFLFVPIEWKPVPARSGPHKATFYVSYDTLRFGVAGNNDDPDDWDWVRLAVTAVVAQQIADLLGVLLPTDRICDLTHRSADVVLRPHPGEPVVSTTARQLRHHAEIEKDRAGRTGLLSTVGKEWILGVDLFPPSAPRHALGKVGAINYGWHTRGPTGENGPYLGADGFILFQTRGFRHDVSHVDYSQWVPRLVHPRMWLDGQQVATADVLTSTDKDTNRLLTYDGPLPDTRYPNLPVPTEGPFSTPLPIPPEAP